MKPKSGMDGSSPEAKLPQSPPKKSKQSTDRAKFKFDPPPEAPVFSPTLEEFENPLKYINKIRPIGQKTGICKIIPPAGWKVPFVLNMDELKFTPRIQRINELEARTRIKLNFIDQLTKFFALRGKTFQIPIVEKRTLDLYTLHKLVRDNGGAEDVTKAKKWGDISLQMGLTNTKTPPLLRTAYDHLILPFITSRIEAERLKQKELGENDGNGNDKSDDTIPSLRELKSLTFLGPGPKMAVCDLEFSKSVKTRTRGKKIMYEFDPLAKYMCKSCSNGEIEETLVTCISCEDRYHSSCLIPPLTEANTVGWRCPKCIATEACKSLEDFGFAQAEREYTLAEFKEMANKFKRSYFKTSAPKEVSTRRVESEFWKVVSSIEESVTVEYGADLHVIDHGSGFPLKNKPTSAKIDPETFSKYAESSWNLNNLPVLKGSVLCHISADISGMKIPWMYAGMCFATFCWHNEDHWSYSINYLHLGEPKTWYGVPGSSAEDFEKAMKAEAPELFDSQPDILHQLVTIMNPNDIMKTGVPIYRTDQKEGEFVITFPRAYHAGFNQGFNFAEACNFAPFDWLHIGRECISHYSSLKRFCVFSHDELVCNMAEIYDELDKKILLATYKDMRTMVNAEHTKRRILLVQGVRNASRIKFDELPDDERQCFVCKTTCFLSAVICKCNPTRLVCLDHYESLCSCPITNYKLKYHYKIDELVAILYVMRNKVEHFDKWLVGMNRSITDPNRKVYYRVFTELLIDSKCKEYTNDELLKVLEEQVKNCLKLSSTAKSFLNQVNADTSKNEKKSVDDLIEFSKQLKSSSCPLVEAKSVHNMLDGALKLKKVARKLLTCRVHNKAKLEQTIRLMISFNLEFPEIPQLELKLKECEWLIKCKDVLSSNCFSEDIQTLIEVGDKLPNSRLVVKQRNQLCEMQTLLHSWTDRVKSIYNHPYLPLEEVEKIAAEGLKINCIDVAERNRLCIMVDNAREINTNMEEILSGKIIMYHNDISQLIDRAKALPVIFKSMTKLQEHFNETSKWLTSAKRLYYKRTAPLDLMNILWPRRFAPRTEFYSRVNRIPYREIEGILKENDPNFSKIDYQNALRDQFTSLFELRMKNNQLRLSHERVCPCGVVVEGGKECYLCFTVYHNSCFIYDISHPTLYNVQNKMLCGFCVRTKRPPLDKVKELLNASKKLVVKIPECHALDWNLWKVDSWLEKANKQLANKQIVSALEIINSNTKLISSAYSLSRDNRSELAPTMSDVECIIDFKHIYLNLELLTSLWILMNEGDLLEVSTKESSNVWMLYEAAKLSRGRIEKTSIPPEIEVGRELIKTKLKVIQKASQKLRKKPNIKRVVRKISDKATRGRPSKTTTSPNSASTNEDPQSPGSSSVLSEHDEEDCCAAENCLKPIEDSLDWVQCDGKCAQWFHMKCVSVDKNDVGDDDEFRCLSCLPDSDTNMEEEEEISFASIDCSNLTLFADPLMPVPKAGRASY